jgi:hypothetical protein
VVFSDLCKINHIDYRYLFSCICLFLYTIILFLYIIHLTQRLRLDFFL